MNGNKNSDVIFYFTSPIVAGVNNNLTLKILNCSFPVSFTLVNDSNNTLVIDDVSHTLTNGNYNAFTLRDHLEEVLGTDYSITYDSVTNKYTFTSLTNFTINGESTCLKLLGLEDGTDTTSTDYELQSTFQLDLSGDNTIYVDVVNLSTTNLSSHTGTRTSIVKSLLNNANSGEILFSEDTATKPLTLIEDHISFLHVRIYGEDCQTLLDFDNANWQITIEIGLVPKQQQLTLVSDFKNDYAQYLDKLFESKKSKQ